MAAWMVSELPPDSLTKVSLSVEDTSPHSAATYINVMNHNKPYAPNAAASTINRILRSYKYGHIASNRHRDSWLYFYNIYHEILNKII